AVIGDEMYAGAQHEAASTRQLLGLVEGEYRARAQYDVGDAVALHRRRLGALRQALCVVESLDRLHGGADVAGGDAQAVVLADPQRLMAEPHEAGAEDVGLDRRMLREAGDGAALDEELLVQREADGLAGLGFGR